MRPVLFQFYTIETFFNIILMFFHIRGFLVLPLDFLPVLHQVNHYLYTLCFYTFTVLTIFASINICTGNKCSNFNEIVRTLSGFLLYTTVSLMTLWDAEKHFHMMYIMGEAKLEVEKPVHPFFVYLRAQALLALICAVVYLMHCIIVIDVVLSKGDEVESDDSDSYNDDMDFTPVRLYVLGELVHAKLEQYAWFNDFLRGNSIYL